MFTQPNDLLGDELPHDPDEGDLDGVGVFKDREDEGVSAETGAVAAEFDRFALEAFVERTETVAAQGGRTKEASHGVSSCPAGEVSIEG
jgi:hypothetical protein